jgi:transcriptional regulator with XRE-family HTH domain
MSVKNQNDPNQTDSSISTLPIKTSKTKIQQTKKSQPVLSENSLMEPEVESESTGLLSPQARAAYKNPEFKLAWQNQIRLHIARHLIRLRRSEGMSQAQLADAMKTSQPAIAKLESGEANFEIETVERAVQALNGRFDVSISPARMNLAPRTPWWELLAATEGLEADYWLRPNETSEYKQLWVLARFQKAKDTQTAWPLALRAGAK